MLFSFIIPVYNCEKYIVLCIQSILSQGLSVEDYEIIVVDDGSTDNSYLVAKEILKFNNTNLISQKNKGVSSARNVGIKAAKGEYIIFVDADDFLIPNGFLLLKDRYFTSSHKPDMLFFSSHTVDRYYNNAIYDKLGKFKELYEGDLSGYVAKFGLRWSVWGAAISRNLILESNVFFKKYIHTEDALFMAELFCARNCHVISTNLNLYRYRLRNGSANTRYDTKFIKRFIIGEGEIIQKLRKFKENSSLSPIAFDERIYCCQRVAFTRICSSLPNKIPELVQLATRAQIFPVKDPNTNDKKIINFIASHPYLFYLVCLPYRFVFLPFIKPHIRRN